MRRLSSLCVLALPMFVLAAAPPLQTLRPQRDSAAAANADVVARERTAAGDAQMRYHLIEPLSAVQPPAAGLGLLIVIPGGDGSASNLPFVKGLARNCIPHEYLIVELVAVKWSPDQRIVWPSRRDQVPGQRFSVEEFVEAVVADIAKEFRLDRRRVFTLSWSSAGPAGYAVSLAPQKSVTGSYIAMSTFVASLLPPIDGARGHAYVIEHASDDPVCSFEFSTRAQKYLSLQGARVKLVTTEGGHGWKGDYADRIRAGILWLEENAGFTPPPAPAAEAQRRADPPASAAQSRPAHPPTDASSAAGSRTAAQHPAPDRPMPQQTEPGQSDAQREAVPRPTAETPPAAELQRDHPADSTQDRDHRSSESRNLVCNGGFEEGASYGWTIRNNSGRMTVRIDRKTTHEGRAALRVSKSGALPIDVVRQQIGGLPAGGRIRVSALLRGDALESAFLKLQPLDASGQPIGDELEVDRLTSTFDWRRADRELALPANAAAGMLSIVMSGAGTAWIDDVRVAPLDSKP
ncbi:MAG: hypothetical protein CHACPFDD_02359 [Phycisphaerae bacterium]|nr:hypothetical protein [Phycisphaerae bacterium]